jgi:hypothetical protein
MDRSASEPLAEHEVYDPVVACDIYAHLCVMVCGECGTEDGDHAEDCRGRGANPTVCLTHR